jgi:hypothetical protein
MAGASGADSTPPTYSKPGMGQTWQIESGDPLNSTAPVMVAVDDGGVVIAGASSDPATVGVDAFDIGILSEAFVARLDANGAPLWQQPLPAAALPWAIARSGDDVVIVAPYLPELAEVSTSYVSKDIYLAKFGLDGTPRYETSITFDYDQTMGYGLAVDASGAIYLSGGYQATDETGFGGHPIVVKCDPDGTKLWEKTFPHTGTQGYGNAVAVLSDGDIVITGAFDYDLSFGGDTMTISSTATLDGLPSGYLARLTPEGEPVWSAVFGSDDFSVGTGLAPLANGDFLLSGSVALDLTVGGITVPGEPYTPSEEEPFPPTAAFVARLSGDGTAEWVELAGTPSFAHVVDSDGSNTVYLAGSLDKEAGGGDVYLRTYDARTGDSLQVLNADAGSGIESHALAVGMTSVWLSGIFSSSADFGNENLLTNQNAGVFLVRLDEIPELPDL